jgi:phage tail-like protein
VSSALSNFQPGDRHPASGRSPDPAPVLRFLVKEGTGIQVEYETLEWPEGGENRFVHKLRGRAKYPNLVLKRGITHEKNLVQWFRDCADRTKRFAITVELLAGDLKPIRRFSFDMAYPVK